MVGDVAVQVAPPDAALAKTMSDLGFQADIDASADIMGGLTVISAGGRVYRRNTLEDRLAKAQYIPVRGRGGPLPDEVG